MSNKASFQSANIIGEASTYNSFGEQKKLLINGETFENIRFRKE